MEILLFLLGVLVGWLIQRLYSRLSSKELTAIFRAFAEIAEERKLVEWQRDAQGKISIGRIIRAVPRAGSIAFTGQAVGVKIERPLE